MILLFITLRGNSKTIFVTLSKRAIAFGAKIVGRALTIWEAIKKRSHEPTTIDTNNESKRLRAIQFAIAKLEER